MKKYMMDRDRLTEKGKLRSGGRIEVWSMYARGEQVWSDENCIVIGFGGNCT